MLDAISKAVISCSELETWPELKEIISKRKPGIISLFNIAYQSTGNCKVDSLQIQAALACFTANCILIDDILDDDEKGVWQKYGAGRTANLAAALHARQQILIHSSAFSDAQKQAVTLLLNQMKLCESKAQELATANLLDLNQYETIVHGKSGNVCGTSMKIGALLGGAHQDQADILYDLGKNLGEVGQISNDLRGAFQKQVNPDWHMTGSSLPILLALTTEHEYLDELTSLLAEGLNEGKTLKRAQDILVACGAVSLCCDQISTKLEKMYQKLCQCNLSKKEQLHKNIGQDIQHAIKWVKDLDVQLSEKTKTILSSLDKQLDDLLA